jgi:hypothetical protein
MQIEPSDEHSENADTPISDSEESGSNVKVWREAHTWKQEAPMVWSGAGIQIDLRDWHLANVRFSSRTSLEFASKVTSSREVQ